MRIYCKAQGTLLNALWWPNWEGNPKKRRYMYMYYWFTCICITEKAMATHSSTLAWKIPRMEEPGRRQSMGSLGVRHTWATSLSLSCIGEGNGNPLQYSCLENPRDGGAWWAAIYGVPQSRTWLKRLSSIADSLCCTAETNSNLSNYMPTKTSKTYRVFIMC